MIRRIYSAIYLCIFLTYVPEKSLAADYVEGYVTLDDGRPHFTMGFLNKSAAAYGYFNDSLLYTGWSILEIETGSGVADNDKMFAAGFLEGVFTAKHMWQHYQNLHGFFSDKFSSSKTLEKDIKNFLFKQDNWVHSMISSHSSDAYWRSVGYIVSHLDGLFEGYKLMAEKEWYQERDIVLFLNAAGDLIDLVAALAPETVPDFDKMSHHDRLKYVNLQGRCSALVKITAGYEELYMAHDAWFTYSATLRIFKHYHFNLADPLAVGHNMSVSSYPGLLQSMDDFYQLHSQKMVLLETTNDIFDKSLYKLVTGESLLAWQRVRLASLLANNGEEWATIVAKYNSGTYNNQYMVIDLKRVHLGESIDDGALWVVEQIPGYVESADETDILRAGYWPSYNVPFFEKIYNLTGYAAFAEKYGTDFSYQLAPRAKIFRRDQGLVNSLESMKYIMRYNNYRNDPYSFSNPCNTICCRGDLDAYSPSPMGCYDSKVTSYSLMQKKIAVIINGPTTSNYTLSPFSWDSKFPNASRFGLPPVYKFDWLLSQPVL